MRAFLTMCFQLRWDELWCTDAVREGTYCLSAPSNTVRIWRVCAFSGSMLFRIRSAFCSSKIGANAVGLKTRNKYRWSTLT